MRLGACFGTLEGCRLGPIPSRAARAAPRDRQNCIAPATVGDLRLAQGIGSYYIVRTWDPQRLAHKSHNTEL